MRTSLGPSLARTSDPHVLISGDVDALRADARSLDARAQDLSWCVGALSGTELGPWSGQARDAYAVSHEQLRTSVAVAATCLQAAATALVAHADILDWAQQRAKVLARQWQVAAATCVPDEDGNALTTQLAPAQVRAQAELDQLRAEVFAAGNAAAAVLEAAAGDAPIVPTFWNQVGYHSSQLWQGGWESVRDLGLLVWEQNGVRVLWDPYGALEAKRALIAGLYTSLQDPKQFAKDLVDWDTWATSPARAIGHMAPDAAIALLTAGGGAVAVRGVRASTGAASAATVRTAVGAVAGQVALDSARRSMGQAVSGFWRDRWAIAMATPEAGHIDFAAFFPNAQTPSWVHPKVDRMDELIDANRESRPWLARLFEGTKYNLTRVGAYEFNEVTIRQPDGSVTYLDSWTPDDVAVSRKTTQLAEVSERYAMGHIDEIFDKYSPDDPDFTIADTPANRAAFADRPELIGGQIRGVPVLEVPVQLTPPPAAVLEYAAARDVQIRDYTGQVLNAEQLGAP